MLNMSGITAGEGYVKAEITTKTITETVAAADTDDQAAGNTHHSIGTEDKEGA